MRSNTLENRRQEMNYKEIKKLFLWLFLGFLVLTALVGIISVLSGEFGEVQFKVLATCLTISAASICSMACAALIEKRIFDIGLSEKALKVVFSALLARVDNQLQFRGEWRCAGT